MPLKFSGFPELAAKLQKLQREFPERFKSALYQEAQIEMTEAKRRTPVWNPDRKVPYGHTPGSLRASGQVHEPERHGGNITVELSFGNELVDYAVYVHEDLEAFHATGEAKFLESTLMESAPHMAERIASRIRSRD